MNSLKILTYFTALFIFMNMNINAQSDLSLRIKSTSEVTLGVNTFVLTVENKGPQEASNTIIELPMLEENKFIIAGNYDASVGSATTSIITGTTLLKSVWSIPNLESGGSATLNLDLLVTLMDDLKIFAQVASTDNIDLDSTPGNGACCNANEDDEVVFPNATGNGGGDGNQGTTYWAESGNHIYNTNVGNVGIGVQNPVAKLDIASGGIHLNGTQLISNGTPQEDRFNMKWTNNFGGVSGRDYLLFEKVDANEGRPDGGIAFLNTGTSISEEVALMIKGDGKIGIGTANPTQELDVQGQIKCDGLFGTGDTRFAIFPTGNSNTSRSYIEFFGNNSGRVGELRMAGTYLSFVTNSTTNSFGRESMRISPNGNVGLGTNNPVAPLHIATGGDASLTGNGQILLGNTNAANVAIDANELQARDNGRVASYWLQFAGGNVGIGAVNPNFQLHLSRNSAGKPGGGMWSNASDARLKKDVKDFEDGLDAILKIRPVWYRYNGKAGLPTDEKYVGVIAQEIQKIAPYTIESYKYEKNGKKEQYLGYNGTALTYMLINAIQELNEIVDDKDDIIKQTNTELQTVKEELDYIKKILSTNQPIDIGVETSSKPMKEAFLGQNIPNPFTTKTSIPLDIPEQVQTATLNIINTSGQLVQTIEVQERGNTTVEVKMENSGNYFYSLSLDGTVVQTKQMITQ